ncbi:DUF2971 domain-containing protein [Paraliobacillus sp. X-1268]|uniref:DUF2971 domain-containing protein n=1 Tax=Paraliobacillus sp. X-1268 TaxID=2213193 RepID=UPI000E3DD3F0|nr:DUF2971 domain-containing protein [Paraliobacillus sp. X-1268]
MKYSRQLRYFITAKDQFDSMYSYNNEYNIHNFNEDESLSPQTNLWKFMNFSKFVSLLEKSSVYFSKPGSFNDPYEGSYSSSDLFRILGEGDYYDEENDEYRIDEDKINDLYEKNQMELDYVGVSCWHLNNEESAAMWDLYCSSGEGVAIRTTLKNIMYSVSSNKSVTHGLGIKYGLVNYIDYTDDMAGVNTYETLFYKRKSFSHEQEFRMLIFENPEDHFFGENGVNIPFDLNILIDEIYVSPTSPVWFKDLIESIVNRYNLNKEVIQSDLYSGPRIIR